MQYLFVAAGFFAFHPPRVPRRSRRDSYALPPRRQSLALVTAYLGIAAGAICGALGAGVHLVLFSYNFFLEG
jgi:hypothetical protein